MNKDQYVDAIKTMMDNQDRYFTWFIGILGLVLVFVGVLQWRLTSKQIEKITADAKDKARTEILAELVESYQLNRLPTLREKVKNAELSIINLNEKIDNLSINGKSRSINMIIEDVLSIDKSPDTFYNLSLLLKENYLSWINDPYYLNIFVKVVLDHNLINGLEYKQTDIGRKALNQIIIKIEKELKYRDIESKNFKIFKDIVIQKTNELGKSNKEA
ncbi:hypothetical protein HR098_00380 [Enterococcus faecalis]|uniref:hypothetical protein n=1 Tax=Enterococcus faecalis TaxID=1351 RepID=UPI000330C733|nr:hypothetical protein [Enterococcus faecalis]EOH64354.1 hypothetical protein UA9_01465 [Enterococcus faecalis EnGen0235]NRC62918.1 hypothetical protein [Enterococcus faecalis]HAP5448675.1 hypothetical protein [Enterococcus faecalis]HAP5608621.1 hypothetical protein [Enterococcus faecalis]HBC2748760.1 hypothetical protein [Enterococcus faecalis]